MHSQNKQHAFTISKQEAKQWQAKVIENMSHIVAVLRYTFLSDSRITNRKIIGGEEVSPLSNCVDTSPTMQIFMFSFCTCKGAQFILLINMINISDLSSGGA